MQAQLSQGLLMAAAAPISDTNHKSMALLCKSLPPGERGCKGPCEVGCVAAVA